MIRAALICVLTALQVAAAPLVIKDNYRSPRNKERSVRKSTGLIVLHTTEAHAKSALNKLSERGEAHYCVTEDGTVYRIVDRDKMAFHAGRSMWNGKEDCDSWSVGIEVVGWHDKTMPLRQLDALKELVSQLKAIYRLKDTQVVCHSHVAYGAPNTWHKKRHRGRKRCGMLFAMPSVRAKLGLAARPASDPDIAAKRLVQGDDYLHGVLYGKTDTMAVHYGAARRAETIAAAPAKPSPAKPAPVKPPAPAKPTAVAAKPAPPPPAAPKPSEPAPNLKDKAKLIVADAAPKPTPPAPKKPAPPPIVKPPVIAATPAPTPAPTKPAPAPVVKPPLIVPDAPKTDDGGLLSSINPMNFFKKKAVLVLPNPNGGRE